MQIRSMRSHSFGRTLLALLVTLVKPASAAVVHTFTVSDIPFEAYVIDGQDNPTLTLTRGQTYVFNVNTPGHPFWVKSVQGITQANAYNDGVTNNGVQVGMLTFAVPPDAPSTLFYNCEFHAPMTGVIDIVDASPAVTETPSPTPTPVPTVVGDCAGTGAVSVADLITLVSIALGNAEPSACPLGIPSGSEVDIPLIVRAVNNALTI
jgi:hypothetical protein